MEAVLLSITGGKQVSIRDMFKLVDKSDLIPHTKKLVYSHLTDVALEALCAKYIAIQQGHVELLDDLRDGVLELLAVLHTYQASDLYALIHGRRRWLP